MAGEDFDAMYELNGVRRKCRIIGERPSGTTMIVGGQKHRGIQFYLEFEDGTKRWSVTYADVNEQVI